MAAKEIPEYIGLSKKEKKAASDKKYRENNKEALDAHRRTPEYRERRKLHYEENREKLVLAASIYRANNPDKVKATHKLAKLKRKDAIKIETKLWYDKNKKRLNAERQYKRHTDIDFKLRHLLSSRILNALRRNSKISRSEELLGCTIKELKAHLESKFTGEMSWDNRGFSGWHIDHIMPCASFDLSDPEQQKKCFHYSNLQPLWAKDNLQKSDKIPTLVNE